MKTTRRQFLTTATTTALGAGALIGAAACSSTDDTTGAGGSAATGCGDEMITGNHGHALTVPQADVDAGVEKTYSIQGSSPHNHDVIVTTADFMVLASGGAVTITSSSDGTHDHDVTVSCV